MMNFLHSSTKNNDIAPAELLDNRKYIILKYLSVFKDWNVVQESKGGVSKLDAQTIFNYEVKYGKTDPLKLIIVEVPEI
ncbi:hypothetical protein A4G16_02435 [Mannheimia granulomatis]|uniref:Uncharacterized protein n=1 Tax=Mannheimia granulomatis TaxID=85402 RepID=A0A6G8JGJ4_9PAST|nr:hypothetical protein [Mannheimia granulomatis]QIM66310.1 hypothetical protein A4G16_02435 [Mannheimia granulomatis]